MSESLKPGIAVAVVGALAVGAAFFVARGPAFQSLDAGIVFQLRDGGPDVPVYQLPDGGPWPVAPDASTLVTCFVGPTALSSFCYIQTGTGYEELGATVLPDGGFLQGVQQPFSCFCATDAGACSFSDGGPVPLTGTYNPTAWGAVSGPGCVRRPCGEVAGWTGAPQGCLP